ncbi:MAG: class I SAM-dependent methyltransferase [Deltaproteobacteria bacterium]|nr:class I SAM-dependent methyltransferase [Deltaproteobacteria bacterium]
MTTAAAVLERGLGELELETTEEQRAGLLKLAQLTETWGRRLNLTGHRSALRIVERLVLDASALSMALPPFESLADLGSGAGYPGLPMAILRPELRVTLVEARERRHHFQKAAVRELGLANARPRRGRAENLDPEPHAAVIAQAMAQPEAALAWMLPWAASGGWLILPGAAEVPNVPTDERSGWVLEPARHYQVPCGGPQRTLWLARAGARVGMG